MKRIEQIKKSLGSEKVARFFGPGGLRVLYLAVLPILFCGLWICGQAIWATDTHMQRELLQQAQTMASAINPSAVKAAAVPRQDGQESIEFRRMREQFKLLADNFHLPAAAVYLLVIRDGAILIGPSSREDNNVREISQEELPEAVVAELRQVLSGSSAADSRPVFCPDDSSVNAIAPIFAPYTSEISAFACVEVSLSDWQKLRIRYIWRTAAPALAGMGVLLGALLLTHLLLIRLHSRSGMRHKRITYAETIACLFSLLALTLGLAEFMRRADRQALEREFEAAAAPYVRMFAREFSEVGYQMERLSVFYASSDQIRRDEFHQYYARSIHASMPGGCFWIPEAKQLDAGSFLQLSPGTYFQRLSGDTASERYFVWQRNLDGERIPVEKRPVYYPVLYAEPFMKFKSLVGYDFGAEPLFAAAIQDVLQTDRPTVVGPHRSLLHDDSSLWMHIFAPGSAASFRGVTAVAVPYDRITAYGRRFPGQIDISVHLLQAGGPPVEVTGIQSRGGVPEGGYGMDYTIPVLFYGQVYMLEGKPSDGWIKAHAGKGERTAQIGGLAVTALLCTLVALLSNRRRILENLVEQRTAALQSSERRFRDTVFNTSDWIWELDGRGCYTFLSEKVLPLLGYHPEELRGRSPTDLCAPELRDGMAEFWRERYRDFKPFREQERIILRKDGETIYLMNSGLALFDDDGRFIGYRGTSTDITSRKRAEALHQEAEDRLRLLLEEAPDAILLFENELGFPILANRQAEQLFGCNRETLCETGVIPYYEPDQPDGLAPAESFAAKIRRVMAGEPVCTERKIRTAQGEIRHCEVRLVQIPMDGKILARASYMDITSRKQAEAELDAARAILQAAMDQSPAGIAIADPPDGRLRYVNRAGLLIRGGSAESLIGITLDQYVAAWQICGLNGLPLAEDELPLARALRYGERSQSEMIIRNMDGDQRVVMVNACPVYSSTGAVIAAVAVFVDVTDRKEAEIAIREAEARYQRLTKHLQTVREQEQSRFSRELHDDIGQIMTALKMDVQLLSDSCTCVDSAQSLLEDMRKLLSDGMQSIHSLCRRLRPVALDDLGLSEALSGLVDEWRRRNKCVCNLFLDMEEEGFSAELKTTVYRMVQECLTNISRHAAASKVDVSLVSDGQELHVSVGDNGRGIDLKNLSCTTSFGLLGLSERVDALGGELAILRLPAGGTRIEVTLPLKPS